MKFDEFISPTKCKDSHLFKFIAVYFLSLIKCITNVCGDNIREMLYESTNWETRSKKVDILMGEWVENL